MHIKKQSKLALAVMVIGVFFVSGIRAATLEQYLIVGMQSGDTAHDASNYELGRVSDNADSAPTVSGPGVGPTISNTPTYDGNVAIVSSSGEVKFSDMKIYADIGVDCAGNYSNCTDSGSNFSNTKYDNAAGGTGLRSIGSTPDGVNASHDMTLLLNNLATVRAFINDLDAGDVTGSIFTSGGDIDSNQTVSLDSGLNILDFSGLSSGTDITVKANLIFQGAADAYAVVLVPDESLFKTSQGNLVIGDGGIGLNNVVIVSLADDNATHFDLSNTDINGVSLWDLGYGGGSVSLDNVSGCTQLVGDDVDVQNVRLSRCAFKVSVIPIPAAVWLFGSALMGLGWIGKRKTSSRQAA